MRTSHSRTVPSQLADASLSPSGLNATPLTTPVWPVSGAPSGLRVPASHNRIVRHHPLHRTQAPSELEMLAARCEQVS